MKRVLHTLVLVLGTIWCTHAQDNLSALLPMPNSVTQVKGKPYRFVEGRCLIIDTDPELRFVATTLANIIEQRTGVRMDIATHGTKGDISLSLDPSLQGNEHYRIEVRDKGITLTGSSVTALYRATMTMDQLMMGDAIATARKEMMPVTIDDAPRLTYRALMLDPARHFIPMEDVKFFIDQMAKYKYNVLQLHLTDDQGWRVAIHSHPKLASAQHYTQEELREIIDYAAQRHIEVVPEVDIPGHTVAILAAYPELSCTHLKHDTVGWGIQPTAWYAQPMNRATRYWQMSSES